MGEIKSVKVDNWGVFFLQKLQNFFNKTDYCDLTLQFRDNSQLKVHRLVLSACTDYFNVLEQTCEVLDDALIMPNELQADVVVPIVNFMYTGTLEFELKMYGKLLKTAKEMNMTVLLKLLEAHRRTMEGVNRSMRPPSPKPIRRRVPMTGVQSVISPQRRVLTTANVGTQQQMQQQRRIIQTKYIPQQIGSTSLVRTSSTQSSLHDAYSMQFKTEPMDRYDTSTSSQKSMQQQHQQSTSPFEQLRKGYNNNKRPATTAFVSPPTKKPNIEDVKEFAEQQRMRKQIAAEYGDDPEYEGMLDDDIHNDDDLDEEGVNSTAATTSSQSVQTGKHEAATATITFKQEANDKSPTIVVKDTSNSKMNHAKIISEVLRQYPHLVKSNKNIKLKIIPSASGESQKIIIKKEPADNITVEKTQLQAPQQMNVQRKVNVPLQQQQQPAVTIKKVMTATTSSANIAQNAAVSAAANTTAAANTQKRRIDSKTMHSLIALGAENTTGPWLCLRCGVNGRPISIPSYRGFRRHLINTHKEIIDAALCEHCGWRSANNRQLHFHMEIEHKVKTNLYTFPECLMCTEIFLDTPALNQHMKDQHVDENEKQQCIYCNKIFAKELQLYQHMKAYHKKQAIEDGIVDFSEEELMGVLQDEEMIEATTKKESQIKILSDISLPSVSTLPGFNTAISSQLPESQFSLSEPQFVNADGNEMILTKEQRKELMSQLNQEHDGSRVVMVLNEPNNETGMEVEQSQADFEQTEDSEQQQDNDEDEFDENEIYKAMAKKRAEAKSEDDAEKSAAEEDIKKILDESKESTENLEWAENLISAHELEDEEHQAKEEEEHVSKKNDDISKKLKELTGDWSEDENEEEESAAAKAVEGADNEADTTEKLKENLEAETDNEENFETSNINESIDGEQTQETEKASSEDDKQKQLDEAADEEHDDIDMALKDLHQSEIDDNEQLVAVAEEPETEADSVQVATSDDAEKTEQQDIIKEDVEKMEIDDIEIKTEDNLEDKSKGATFVETPTEVVEETESTDAATLEESDEAKAAKKLLDDFVAEKAADIGVEDEFIDISTTKEQEEMNVKEKEQTTETSEADKTETTATEEEKTEKSSIDDSKTVDVKSLMSEWDEEDNEDVEAN